MYRFNGRIIKLNEQDFDLWKRRFWAIPDIEATLWSLDDFYFEKEVKDWFIRASRALQNQHQEWVLKRDGKSEFRMTAKEQEIAARVKATREKLARERAEKLGEMTEEGVEAVKRYIPHLKVVGK